MLESTLRSSRTGLGGAELMPLLLCEPYPSSRALCYQNPVWAGMPVRLSVCEVAGASMWKCPPDSIRYPLAEAGILTLPGCASATVK